MDGATQIPLPTELILAKKQDGIGWLTINQPERHNAISLAMWDAIGLAVEDFAADPVVRVVVIHGAGGRSFAAGADISEFEKSRADAAGAAEYARRSAISREALDRLEKPVIAMIQGYCIGGGLALALRADLRLASPDSRFGIPAAKLGIAYGTEGLERLTALVGPGMAKEILFTGAQYTAAEALAMSLINRVVAPEELEETVRSLAGQIARNAPLSLRASKITVDQITGDPAKRDPERIAALGSACFDSADYAEGRRAFMAKRMPVFTGR
ncbi:MAG TPA: enoyl-CoA hydratase [Falsiroseomonas sp.]|jgi:enoyl-CoA hydratase/carnithine racemase|nr:enoyl-CoA hydratase [Falsiroseomonas sp.]